MHDDETVARTGGASFRRGSRRPARRSAALGRLRRRCRQAQRARGAAALRRDGREVRQPEPRHAGRAQEDGAIGQQAAGASAVHLAERRHAADGGRHRSTASIPNRFACAPTSARIYPENGGWRVSHRDGWRRALRRCDSGHPGECRRRAARRRRSRTRAQSARHHLQLLGHRHAGLLHGPAQGLPPGFGFLVPRSEGTRMLACTFVHNKFPHRAPEAKGILRCFLGGARDEAVLALTDDEMLETVRRELSDIVKLDARPMFARVYRWRGAMAQYESGHIARVAAHREARGGDSRTRPRRQRLSRHRRARLHSLRHGSGQRRRAVPVESLSAQLR